VTERVPSDHDTVETHRVHLAQVGRTRRLQVELPETLECPIDDVISLSLEADAYHAQVTASLDGPPTVRRAFPTRQLARSPDAESDKLSPYLDAHGLDAGDPLALDVLRTGYAYGLRRPGERVVYAPPDPPNSTLVDIARDVERGN